MAQIKFYLKGALSPENLTRKSKEEADNYFKKKLPLIMSVSVNGERILYPLGFSIPPKFWDTKKNRIKTLSELPAYLENKNESIIDTELKVTNHFNDLNRYI